MMKKYMFCKITSNDILKENADVWSKNGTDKLTAKYTLMTIPLLFMEGGLKIQVNVIVSVKLKRGGILSCKSNFSYKLPLKSYTQVLVPK